MHTAMSQEKAIAHFIPHMWNMWMELEARQWSVGLQDKLLSPETNATSIYSPREFSVSQSMTQDTEQERHHPQERW